MMGAMDQVSPDLYVGSIWALSSIRDLQNANITHVISVLRGNVKDVTGDGIRQLHIEIDDDDEEDIMRFFPRTNSFILEAVKRKERTLVHCIAGISRSVSVAAAFLLWQKLQRNPHVFDDCNENVPEEKAAAAAENHVEDMIEEIRKGRYVANPNESFREQLSIYIRSGCPNTSEELSEKKLYRQWVLRKQADGIPLSGKPPKTIQYLSENGGVIRLKSHDTAGSVDAENEPRHITADEVLKQGVQARKELAEKGRASLAELSSRISIPQNSLDSNETSATAEPVSQVNKEPRLTQLRCKKCRAGLASSQGFMIHAPGSSDSPQNLHSTSRNTISFNGAPRNGLPVTASISPQCTHYYMEPAIWMRKELDQGHDEGKFLCPNPKCNAKVGTYSWHGDKCSCGKWITPAIGLLRARVDEVPIRQPL